MQHSDPRPNHITEVHVHKRDWRPCPALLPSPLIPRKAAAVWLFQWAEAVRHEETFNQFVQANPTEFSRLAEAS